MSLLDYADLAYFEARQSDDSVKTDLELTCTQCGAVVCDVEPGDLLSVLCLTVRDHVCGEGQ